MPDKPESLYHIAKALGYDSEHAMLHDLYTKQNYSISDLAVRLGYSHANIRIRLLREGINLRSRGGANRIKPIESENNTDELLSNRTQGTDETRRGKEVCLRPRPPLEG